MARNEPNYFRTPNGTIDLTLDDSCGENRGVIDLTNEQPANSRLRHRHRANRRNTETVDDNDEVETLGSVLAQHSSTNSEPQAKTKRRLVLPTNARSLRDSPDVVILNEQRLAAENSDRKKSRKLSPTKTSAACSSQRDRSSVTGGFCCPICLDSRSKIIEEERYLSSTTCGHVFCNECIESAISRQSCCPTCRKKLGKRSIHRLYL